MAAHRYWRAVALEAYGAGDLELSCFHLLDADGVRLDAAAALTANMVPATGLLADLQDDDLTTAARWPAQSVARLTLTWDFGVAPVSVRAIRVNAPVGVRALLMASIQTSIDGVAWIDVVPAAGIPWLGPLQSSVVKRFDASDDPYASSVISNLSFKSGILDSTGRTWAGTEGESVAGPYGIARKITTQSTALTSPRISLGAPDWTVELLVKVTPVTGKYCWLFTQDGIAAGSRGFQFLYGESEGCFLASLQPGVMPIFQGPPLSASATAEKYLFVVFQRRGGTLSIAVEGDVRHTAIAADYVVPDIGTTPLTLGPTIVYEGIEAPFSLAALRVTLGAARYMSDFSQPLDFDVGVVGLNKIRGRVALVEEWRIGRGPVIIYGIPKLLEPVSLGVETGSVKDFTSGVLGTGRGRVAGTVKERGTPTNTPVYRKVRLIRERDGLLIRELWSHPVTGAYSFDYIDEMQTFTVLSYDHTGAFRAVVADGQIPELMS